MAEDLQHRLPQAVLPASPSPVLLVVVRVGLAIALAAALLNQLGATVHRPLHALYEGLGDGTVTSVTIELPPPEWEATGSFRVEWTQVGHRPARSTYDITPDPEVVAAEAELILDMVAASPGDVVLEVHPEWPLEPGVRWNVVALLGFAALVLLVLGPQPRLATRWAWFWLCFALPPLWISFLLFEPVPVWSRTEQQPVGRRLTGLWAFLVAVVVAGPMLAVLMPEYADVLTGRWQP